MGADITWKQGDRTWYFRDAYNRPSNLAWVDDLSYWQAAKGGLKGKKEMFKKMANISDEKIKKYAQKEGVDDHWLYEQRDLVRKKLPFIENSSDVNWSV